MEKQDNAVYQFMLDERLAMATQPIWEELESQDDQRDRDDNKQQEDIDPKIDGLTQKKLAERFGKNSSSTITKARKEERQTWEDYCRQHDLDGWIWHLSGGKYYPEKKC